MNSSPDAERLIARFDISQVLYRYCRGIDRMDADLIRSCFFPDAQLAYSPLFRGDADEFINWVWPIHRSLVAHVHELSNIICEVRGDTAATEAYGRITLRGRDERGTYDIINQGRYLDEWALEGRNWRITRRNYMRELRTIVPVVARDRGAGVTAHRETSLQQPSRDRNDPSYRLFQS